jgi:hypothetical protein
MKDQRKHSSKSNMKNQRKRSPKYNMKNQRKRSPIDRHSRNIIKDLEEQIVDLEKENDQLIDDVYVCLTWIVCNNVIKLVQKLDTMDLEG